jgi:hypothetical protein
MDLSGESLFAAFRAPTFLDPSCDQPTNPMRQKGGWDDKLGQRFQTSWNLLGWSSITKKETTPSRLRKMESDETRLLSVELLF